jgi:hypothetical protein
MWAYKNASRTIFISIALYDSLLLLDIWVLEQEIELIVNGGLEWRLCYLLPFCSNIQLECLSVGLLKRF